MTKVESLVGELKRLDEALASSTAMRDDQIRRVLLEELAQATSQARDTVNPGLKMQYVRRIKQCEASLEEFDTGRPQ